jgi:hypothetical protein
MANDAGRTGDAERTRRSGAGQKSGLFAGMPTRRG